MASYHLAVKTVQRSAGRSATAAAAYRHAERIACHREGRVHDYRAKTGVEHSFLVLPEDAPEWAHDRHALWNAAEAREARVNSVTAREWELALPAELDADGRRLLVAGFAAELVARYGVAADVAIHAPHREGDQRNWHAHVLTTTRQLTHEGLTDKTRVLDAKQTGGPEIALMRERWAEMQNHALERHGHEERVDHRSLVAQREAALTRGDELAAETLDRAPEVKLGPAVSAVERREQRQAEADGHEYVPLTERGIQVHEARAERSLLQELAQVRDRLRHELHERAELAHEAYSHAREDGTDRIRAGLAALRAAAHRQGIGHGQKRTHGLTQGLGHSLTHGQAHGRERDDEARHERQASRASIKERLGRILGRDAAHDHHDHHNQEGPVAGLPAHEEECGHRESTHSTGHGLEAIRERLDALRARERPHAQHEAPAAGLPTHGREQERTHGEQAHGLDPIRERLNAVLARAKPVAHETPAQEQDGQAHRQRARGHGHEDDGDGWGL